MLNYIWGGLIVLSLIFALSSDISDFANDRYRNETPLPVTVTFPEDYDTTARRQPVNVRITAQGFKDHYGVAEANDTIWPGILIQTEDGRELRFASGEDLAEPLHTICAHTGRDDCRGPIAGQPTSDTWTTAITFDLFAGSR